MRVAWVVDEVVDPSSFGRARATWKPRGAWHVAAGESPSELPAAGCSGAPGAKHPPLGGVRQWGAREPKRRVRVSGPCLAGDRGVLARRRRRCAAQGSGGSRRRPWRQGRSGRFLHRGGNALVLLSAAVGRSQPRLRPPGAGRPPDDTPGQRIRFLAPIRRPGRSAPAPAPRARRAWPISRGGTCARA